MGYAELLGFWFSNIKTFFVGFFYREEGGKEPACLNGSDKSRLIDANSYFRAMADSGLFICTFGSYSLSTHYLLGPKFRLWEYVDNPEQHHQLPLPIPHPSP